MEKSTTPGWNLKFFFFVKLKCKFITLFNESSVLMTYSLDEFFLFGLSFCITSMFSVYIFVKLFSFYILSSAFFVES